MVSRPAVFTAIALVIGLFIGLGIGIYTIGPPTPIAVETKKFYVVAVEWTFGLYDSNFRMIDEIRVRKGDRVVITIFPKPFIPLEVYEEHEHEFIEWAIGEGLLASEEDFEGYEHEAEEALGTEALGIEFIPHGFAIEGYEHVVNVFLSEGKPVTVEFTADKAGTFDIYCSLICGWGHGVMRLTDAFIVEG